MMNPKRYEGIVKSEAWECYRRLPSNTQYSVEDLEQEGWVVFCKVSRCRLRAGGGAFSTLLTTSIRNRFNNILRNEYKNKRSMAVSTAPETMETLNSSPEPSPDEMLIYKQVIEELQRIEPELADLFINGVSPELLAVVRRKNRSVAAQRGWPTVNMRMTFGVRDIEKFFGVSLQTIFDHLRTTGV